MSIIIACLLSMNAMAQNKDSNKFELFETSSNYYVSFSAEVVKGTMKVLDTTFTAKDNKALRTVRTQFKTSQDKLMETKVTEAWDDKLKRWSFHSGSMEPVDPSIMFGKFSNGGTTQFYRFMQP